jgi:O-antigen ligase
MTQQQFSSHPTRFQRNSSASISTTIMLSFLLCLGETLLILFNPLIGVAGGVTICLIAILLKRTGLALPLFIVVAGPSLAFSPGSSGILSRLYVGDLLFGLIVVIWLLREIAPVRKMGLGRSEWSIIVSLLCLALVGIMSIVYSRMFPDPAVTYAFVHSTVSLTVVNLVEVWLLISTPLLVLMVPRMVRMLKDAQWMIGAYLVIGLPYALGTIFAGPLHLYSQEVILGVQRPQVFGMNSSNLGILNVQFTCIALSLLLYTRKGSLRLGLGLLTCIFAASVAMTFGRESWIGLLLAVWAILWFRFKNPLTLLFPLIVLPLVLLIFPGVVNFFDPTKVYGADRINIWQDAITIWQHSPYMGVGAGNFQFFDIAYGTEVVGVAHNQFLEVLAEMGVQGLVCLLVTIVMIGHVTLKRFNTALSDTGKAISLAYLGYFAALLFATFFTDSFVASTAAAGGTGPFLFLSYSWVFLGLVLSIPNWDHKVGAQCITPTSVVPTSSESVSK